MCLCVWCVFASVCLCLSVCLSVFVYKHIRICQLESYDLQNADPTCRCAKDLHFQARTIQPRHLALCRSRSCSLALTFSPFLSLSRSRSDSLDPSRTLARSLSFSLSSRPGSHFFVGISLSVSIFFSLQLEDKRYSAHEPDLPPRFNAHEWDFVTNKNVAFTSS